MSQSGCQVMAAHFASSPDVEAQWPTAQLLLFAQSACERSAQGTGVPTQLCFRNLYAAFGAPAPFFPPSQSTSPFTQYSVVNPPRVI
jgi:hypothetical protein